MKILTTIAAIVASFLFATVSAPVRAQSTGLATPTAVSPSANAVWLFTRSPSGEREKFVWKSVSGATSYEFEVGTSAACKTECVRKTFKSTGAGVADFATTWWGPGPYFWRVRAVGVDSKKKSVQSAWSVERKFTTTGVGKIVHEAKRHPEEGLAPVSKRGSHWLTDVDDAASGDNFFGMRIEAAINLYKNSSNVARPPLSSTLLSANMVSALTAAGTLPSGAKVSGFSQNDAILLAAKIMEAIPANPGAATPSGSDLLAALNFRAMCKEFADTMVILGGGQARTYGLAKDVGTLDPRPGAYFFVFRSTNAKPNEFNPYHSGLINAVRFDSADKMTFRVSEANYGPGWSTRGSVGQVPWKRSVSHKREFAFRDTTNEKIRVR